MKKSSTKHSDLVELRQTALLARIAAGETIKAIARDTNRHERQLYAIAARNHDLIRESISEARAVIQGRLPALVAKSLDILERQLDHGLGDAKLKSAQLILGLAVRLGDAKHNPLILNQPTDGNHDKHTTELI